jgi:hypothetical protein
VISLFFATLFFPLYKIDTKHRNLFMLTTSILFCVETVGTFFAAALSTAKWFSRVNSSSAFALFMGKVMIIFKSVVKTQECDFFPLCVWMSHSLIYGLENNRKLN